MRPQATEKGTMPRRGYPGQAAEATRKEQHHEGEEGYGKTV